VQDEVRLRVDKEAELILDRIVDAIEMRLREFTSMSVEIEKIANAFKELSNLGLENLPSILEGVRDDAQSAFDGVATHSETSSKKLDTIVGTLGKLEQLDDRTKALSQALSELNESLDDGLQDLQTSRKESLGILGENAKVLKAVGDDVISSNKVLDQLHNSSEDSFKAIAERESSLLEKHQEQGEILTDIRSAVNDTEERASALNELLQEVGKKLDTVSSDQGDRLVALQEDINLSREGMSVLKTSLEERIAGLEQNLSGVANELQTTRNSMTAVQGAVTYLIQPWWKRLFGKGRP